MERSLNTESSPPVVCSSKGQLIRCRRMWKLWDVGGVFQAGMGVISLILARFQNLRIARHLGQ